MTAVHQHPQNRLAQYSRSTCHEYVHECQCRITEDICIWPPAIELNRLEVCSVPRSCSSTGLSMPRAVCRWKSCGRERMRRSKPPLRNSGKLESTSSPMVRCGAARGSPVWRMPLKDSWLSESNWTGKVRVAPAKGAQHLPLEQGSRKCGCLQLMNSPF